MKTKENGGLAVKDLFGIWKRKQTGLKVKIVRFLAGRLFWESATGSGSVDWFVFMENYERVKA